MIFASTTTATTRISTTVMPSSESSRRVALRAGKVASTNAPARAMNAIRNSAQPGGLFQTPMRSRKFAPKMPAAVLVTHA